MRMVLKVSIPVEAGNAAIKSGLLQKTMEATMEKLKPEAAYFFAQNGQRTAFIFFDMDDSSRLPVIAEPLFMAFNASVELCPAMNADDLRKGIEQAAKNF